MLKNQLLLVAVALLGDLSIPTVLATKINADGVFGVTVQLLLKFILTTTTTPKSTLQVLSVSTTFPSGKVAKNKTAKAKVAKAFKQLGMTASKLNYSPLSAFVNSGFNDTTLMILGGLLSLLLIVSIFEKLHRSKAYAVARINGLEGFNLFKFDFAYVWKFLFSGVVVIFLLFFWHRSVFLRLME